MIDLRQGDCLELMKDIQNESIDLVVTDPPYLIKYKTSHRKDKKHDFCSEILNDDNYDLISNYIKECLNRNFIGIELDEKYFNIAKERIESGE